MKRRHHKIADLNRGTSRSNIEACVEAKNAEATRLFQANHIKKAVTIWEDLLAASPALHLADAQLDILYNLACGYSRLGMLKKSMSKLEVVVAAGYCGHERIQEDLDFANIRGLPGYEELIERLRIQQAIWDGAALKTPFCENVSTEEKVAGLSKLWSEVKFNFAWFEHLPDLDWDNLYMKYLPDILKTTSTLEYYCLLQQMCASLQDGHTCVHLPKELVDRACSKPPLRTRLVEDKVSIVEVLDEDLRQDGITVGLEVLEIDCVPVKEYAARKVAPYQSASTKQGLEVKTYEYSLLAGPRNTPVELLLQDAKGNHYKRSLARTVNGPQRHREPFTFEILSGKVAYVALNAFDEQSIVDRFACALDSIRGSGGLIVDIRENDGGSSSVGWMILSYLTDKPFLSTKWRTRDYRPAYRAWKRGEGWHEEPPQELRPHGSKPYIKPVVLLTSPRTFSAAEDFAVAFDAMGRGKIIGEATGGSSGQPLIFPLPGGGTAWVCTKQDKYPDGRDFVAVGVQPRIRVVPTIDDVRAGRDTVLEAALACFRPRRQSEPVANLRPPFLDG